MGIDQARLDVGGDGVSAVFAHRLLRGVAGGVDRQHHRGLALWAKGERAVAVVGGGDQGAGDDDRKRLIVGGLRVQAVALADQVVGIVVGIVALGRLV
ncbi:hypothetical protein PAB09_11220 [Corynebacterium sp. SCR221107]|uniref:hypothetical protein n=1 Tax=Corynebacterium sp. SCR221107 TaxID=3017361 RepID=UPI0022EC21B8|nr:hypothetical protein [Corynebacterium sp. SCR221107]WBT08426.1 hypothetical protein PAB09_11220 [Corynebacterium sp. SCR221107]